MVFDGIVVVSGVPGSGKTTLARSLAPLLNLPLLSKDAIKEALFDALGTGDLEWSENLGRASHRIMYSLARDARSAVLESHFWRGVAESELTEIQRPLLQVYCRCPLDLAVDRYRNRATSPDRHPGHLPQHQTDKVIERWRSTEQLPLELDAPLIEVDTSGHVDVAQLANSIISIGIEGRPRDPHT